MLFIRTYIIYLSVCNYVNDMLFLVFIGDIEDCLMTPISQGHFTPLPEAVCEVVLQLTSQGRPAVLESIRRCLAEAFPHIQPPAERVLYDTLSQLTTERKIYQTARGYFIVTPEYV